MNNAWKLLSNQIINLESVYNNRNNLPKLISGVFSRSTYIPVICLHSENISIEAKESIFSLRFSNNARSKKVTKAEAYEYFQKNSSLEKRIITKDGTEALLGKGCMVHFEGTEMVIDFILTINKQVLTKKGFTLTKVNTKDLFLFINNDSASFIKETRLACKQYLDYLQSIPTLNVVNTSNIKELIFGNDNLLHTTPINPTSREDLERINIGLTNLIK